MKSLKYAFAAVLLICGLTVLAGQEGTARGLEIMTLVENRPAGRDEWSRMTMTLTDKRGRTRERELELYALDEGDKEYSMIFFRSPADVEGVGLLSLDEGDRSDQWLYMPALGRSRRIASSSKDESFMGSDFNYEDLEPRSVDSDIHRYLGNAVEGGRECWMVESVPRGESAYSKRISWADPESLILVRVDFYDAGGGLWKRLIADRLGLNSGYWQTRRMVMTDLEKERSTTLVVEESAYDRGLVPSFFHIGTLEGGAP